MNPLPWRNPDPTAPVAEPADSELHPAEPRPALPSHMERALLTLTTKMQTCVQRLDDIERRLDEIVENFAHAPSHSDVLEVRIHSAKLAAELARATVELRSEIGMANDEARRASFLARNTDQEDVPFALPVDLDLTNEDKKPDNWSAAS